MTSGELLARFVADVDGLQDVWVRVVLPYAAGGLAGAGAVVLLVVLVPAAGAVLAISLVVSAVLAPRLSVHADRGAALEVEPRRARYQTATLDLLDGATELSVYGALGGRLATLADLDQGIAAAEAHTARAAGRGTALAVAAGGAAMWAGLWFGVGAVQGGSLAAVSLAVVALVPLAVHEVFSRADAGRPAGAGPRRVGRAGARRARRARLRAGPDGTGHRPGRPYGIRIRDLTVRWSHDGRAVLTEFDLDLVAGDSTVIVAPSGAGKSTLAAVLMRLLEPVAGGVELVGRAPRWTSPTCVATTSAP